METQVLFATGKARVKFTGELVVSVTSKKPNSTRWREVNVYVTQSGRLVWHDVHRTMWENESDNYTVLHYDDWWSLLSGIIDGRDLVDPIEHEAIEALAKHLGREWVNEIK